MIEIERGRAPDTNAHRIYTAEEAEAEGLPAVPWQLAQPGQWALTDDGFVAECLGRTGPYESQSGSRSSFVRLSFGDAWTSAKRLDFGPFHAAGHYGGTKPRPWQEREAQKARARRAVRAYVLMLVGGDGVDWHLLGAIYRPEAQRPAKTVKALLKQTRIQTMIREELQQALSEHGVTREQAFAILGQIAQDGLKAGASVKDRIAALNKLEEYLPELKPAPEREEEYADFTFIEETPFEQALREQQAERERIGIDDERALRMLPEYQTGREEDRRA